MGLQCSRADPGDTGNSPLKHFLDDNFDQARRPTRKKTYSEIKVSSITRHHSHSVIESSQTVKDIEIYQQMLAEAEKPNEEFAPSQPLGY